jgi:hypothetical protein
MLYWRPPDGRRYILMQSPQDLSKIEAELKQKLTSAKEVYEAARFDDERLQRIKRDLGLAHPDGAAAIRDAVRVELLAFKRYIEALRAFSDFILLRKLPRDLPKRVAPHGRCEKQLQLEEALVCIIQSPHTADPQERGLLAAERQALSALQDHFRKHGCGEDSKDEQKPPTGGH